MSASFSGIGFGFQEVRPTTPNRTAGFSGISFVITPKTLVVQVFRLQGRQYLPVQDMAFNVLLANNQVERIATNAAGFCSIDFPDNYIEVSPVSGTVPGGHHYTQVTKMQTVAKNYLTVTLIPDALERYYVEWQLLD